MVQYIDKEALIAEIERLYDEKGAFYAADVLYNLKEYLDTLEVKEVDLEKELENWRYNHFHGRRDKEASGEYLERVSQLDIAKHFYELGLKAQKGEKL